jgi:uncharacterized membrane protein
MRLLKTMAPAWGLIVLMAGLSLWARQHLPDTPIAVHFNGRFEPDGYWPRDEALAWPPLFMAAMLLVLMAAPFVMPPKGALIRSAPAYGAVCTAIVGVLGALQAGTIARALNWPVQMPQVMAWALGLLFMVLGNFLSKVRYNLVFGIRTPWTLASERVWDRTHRMAAPLFVLGGLFILAGGLLAPDQFRPVLLTGALVPALAACAYSYWLWSRLPEDEKTSIGIWRKGP